MMIILFYRRNDIGARSYQVFGTISRMRLKLTSHLKDYPNLATYHFMYVIIILSIS